jgi:uncharacterized membrane protein
MKTWWVGCGVALAVMGLLDGVWLGVIAADFYRQELGDLMRAEPRWLPAALFYLGYPAALVTLALQPLPARAGTALWRSALVGLLAYATYDLTNLATLRHWSLRLVVVDIAWGTLATAVAGSAAWFAMRRRG